MNLGIVACKVGGARQCSSIRKEVSMQLFKLRPPGIRHHHTELFIRIVYLQTNTVHINPARKEEGRVGRKIALKWQASNVAKVKAILQELQASDCDKSHKMALVRAKHHSV